MSGVWNCTQKTCDSTCHISGGHIQTFDGASIYFNGGDCLYSLVEPAPNNTKAQANIQVKLGVNPDVSSITYDSQYLIQPRMIIVNFNNQEIKLTADKSGSCADLLIEINGNNGKSL